MSKVKNENFIAIQGWMVSELGLKGNSLLIYAIIYGFSQAEGQVFTGSLQYLADWTNSTKQGVLKNLKSLIDAGLIGKKEKNINGVKFVEYYITKFNGVLNKVEWGIKQSLPNNIEYNIKHNIDKERKIKKERSSEEAMELALLLQNEILKRYPNNLGANKKDCVDRWAKDIDKMINIDKRDVESIRRAIIWALNDNFWQKNIWSGANLRKHYDKLEAEAKAKFLKYGSITV